MRSPRDSFFISGGPLSRDAACYVTRRADQELYDLLQSGEFCYILTARQMGKSSLMVRTAARLRDEAVTVAALDLTALGQNVTPSQWYRGLLGRLGRQLGVEDKLDRAWEDRELLGPVQRWVETIGCVLLSRFSGQIVLFIDEIDVVRSLPFSADEFFAAIRECYNRRTQEPSFERLTFCFLGVATPSDLIRNVLISPFNIGRRIELTDFTRDECIRLEAGIAGGRRVLDRVLHWTGGHPYLTQRLCRALAEPGVVTGLPTARDVDRLCAAIFLGHGLRQRTQDLEDNIRFVQDRLLRSDTDPAAVIDLYGKILSGRRVWAGQNGILEEALRLAGVVRINREQRLLPRNRIYSHVFDRRWVANNLPNAEQQRQRAAYLRGLTRATLVSACVVLAMGALVAIALRYAQQSEKDRIAADARAAELKIALAKLKKSMHEEALQRRRADGERRQAIRERIEANHQKRIALKRTQESQERWERLLVLYGTRLQDEGDLFGSLPWLVRAASRPLSDPSQRLVHQIRIGTLLRQLPRLNHQWSGIQSARFSTDGRKILTTAKDGTARVWDTVTGVPLSSPIPSSEAQTRDTGDAPDGHRIGDDILPAVFTPDGRRVATFTDAGARVWDTQTGKPLTSVLRHQYWVTGAALSPDGQRLITGDRAFVVRLWDVTTGRLLQSFNIGGKLGRSLSLSPDGHLLALATDRGFDTLWNTSRNQAAWKLPQSSPTPLFTAFSSDGRRFICAVDRNSAQVFNVENGMSVTPILNHTGGIASARFSSDGTRVVTASWDHTAQIWNASTGARIGTPLQHSNEVYDACFCGDDRRIATASADTTARIWDAVNGEPLSPPLKHSGAVASVAFNPDGRLLLSVDKKGIARLWDVAGAGSPDHIVGEYGNVSCAAFSPNGQILATGDFDFGAHLWSVKTGHSISPLLEHNGAVRDIAFHPNGKCLVTASDDGTACVWDTQGQLLASLRQGDPILHIAFSKDGRYLATSSYHAVAVWRTTDWQRASVLKVPDKVIDSIAFRPQGDQVLTSSEDTARVWAASSGKLLVTLPHNSAIGSVSFSPDGKMILTTWRDGQIQLRDIGAGHSDIRWTRQEHGINSAIFGPTGQSFVTASNSGEVRVWNTVTGEPTTPPMNHRSDALYALFSHSGRFIATYSRDRTARVWESVTGQAITPPLRHSKKVRGLIFSPDDRSLLTVCDDGTGRLWELTRDEHRPTELLALADVLSSHRLSTTGGVSDVEPSALQSEWKRLSAIQGSAYGPSINQRRAWEIAEAVEDGEANQWRGCLSHVDWLMAKAPSNRMYRVLHAYACAQLGYWNRVAADCAAMHYHTPQLFIMEARRPVVNARKSPHRLQIGQQYFTDGFYSYGDTKILVLLPGTGKHFTASGGIITEGRHALSSTITQSVFIKGKEIVRTPDQHNGQGAVTVSVSLDSATAFVLQTHHSGDDIPAAWVAGKIELGDGRRFSLSDLPIHVVGNL